MFSLYWNLTPVIIRGEYCPGTGPNDTRSGGTWIIKPASELVVPCAHRTSSVTTPFEFQRLWVDDGSVTRIILVWICVNLFTVRTPVACTTYRSVLPQAIAMYWTQGRSMWYGDEITLLPTRSQVHVPWLNWCDCTELQRSACHDLLWYCPGPSFCCRYYSK